MIFANYMTVNGPNMQETPINKYEKYKQINRKMGKWVDTFFPNILKIYFILEREKAHASSREG